MAYNPYDPYNQGIGTLDLGNFGLQQQPQENMTVAEAINYGVLPQAQESFTPKSTMTTGALVNRFMKENPNATKGDFVNALQSGSLGVGGSTLFDKNVDSLFEGVNLDKSGLSWGDVSPQFIGTTDGTFRGNIDIDKGALSPDAIKSLPGGFFKSVGDQSSLPGMGVNEYGYPLMASLSGAIPNKVTTTDEPLDIEDFLGTSVPENVTIGQAPSVFDINTMGDPALNAESINVLGSDPYGEVVSTGRPNMRDVAGDINENLIDRGNPYNDPRVVSEEQSLVGGITDRGRGMAAPGEMGAYEMIGGTPVAIGDVLGRQQALEKADFYEPSRKKGIDFGDLLGLAALAYTGPYKGAVKAGSMLNNLRTGRLGKVVDTARGIPGAFAKKMRGVNPITGRANTQREYEANRAHRRRNKRIDNMLDRKAKGKNYSQKILNELTMGSRPGQYDKPGGDAPGRSKIVCTMMNDRYGFGSFRNKIWMKFHENHGPEYQKGYHTIFLPLVKIAKGEGKLNTAVRKVLEHMGRHVTADMFKIMKGKKRDTLGRIYRAIFEPTCRIIGKIKSALGRG